MKNRVVAPAACEPAPRGTRLRSGIGSLHPDPVPGRVKQARESGLCLLTLLAVTVAVFRRHLFSGFTFPWDFIATSHRAVFVAGTAGSGRFTEWIPFVGGGLSLPQDALSGVYFPLWWLLGALRIPATISVLTAVQVLHVFLGAAGVYFLARSHRLAWPWALVASTGYVFFGGFYGNGSHDVIVRGHAYAPWLLWVLTVPRESPRWSRIIFLPLLVWVIATGSYAGQVVAFLQVGAVYLAVEIWLSRRRLREIAPYLVPALLGSAAVLAAVYLPYLVAERSRELYRPYPPTAGERARWALQPVDLWGLYLNPFAWKIVPATIASWSVGVVALIGAACLGARDLLRNASLVAAGLAAASMAMLPSWPPAARVLARPWLSPSRLPASDFKAMAAVALVCLAAMGWIRVAGGVKPGPVPVAVGLLVILGIFLAPEVTSVPATRLPWLLVLVVVSCLAIAYRTLQLSPAWLAAAVLALTLVEGARVISDMEIYPGQKPWSIAPELFPDRALHDAQARGLSSQLENPPSRRPARIPITDVRTKGGNLSDALGFLGASYYLGDYGGTVTMARRRVMNDPALTAFMLKPWTPVLWSCGQVDCSGKGLPVPGELAGTDPAQVVTTSYGLSRIRYRVALQERSLMVENEIWARGWRADRPGVKAVSVGGTLRGWILPSGTYTFTASYSQPERTAQMLLAAIGLAAMAASAIAYRRSPAGSSGGPRRGISRSGTAGTFRWSASSSAPVNQLGLDTDEGKIRPE